MDAVIDVATSRPSDPQSVYVTDWDGKVNLLQACERAEVRFVFLSLPGAHRHRDVPLMDIKACTENFLESSDLDYTILQGAAFMQGVIGQFAIPVLEGQTVWVSGSPTAIAYMNTQDVARFAVAALQRPETVKGSFPWWVPGPGTPVNWCSFANAAAAKRLGCSGFQLLIRLMQGVASFFEPAVNVAERLAFAEVTGGGQALDAPMESSYAAFDLDPAETTNMESYIREYYDTILKRLREMEADLDKDAKKKLPF